MRKTVGRGTRVLDDPGGNILDGGPADEEDGVVRLAAAVYDKRR